MTQVAQEKQKLSSWAAIAEITAAVGVIVSLLFVGFELNEGNRETRAATLLAAMQAEMALQSNFLQYPEILEKLASGGRFEDPVEIRRAIVLYNMLMSEFENRHLQYEAGFLDDAIWRQRMVGLRRVVGWPFYETWRNSTGAIMRSPRFLELVAEVRSNVQ